MIDPMPHTPRVQLLLRWLWLWSMLVVAAAFQLPAIGWIVLGLACGLAAWLSSILLGRTERAPSKPWLLGVDLALGVGLIASSASWQSPFFSVWLLLGVVEGLSLGMAAGLRLASLGLVLTGLSLAVFGRPGAADLLAFSLLVLVILSATWLMISLGHRLWPDQPTEPLPESSQAGEASPPWMLEAAASLGAAADESQVVERALDFALGCAPSAAGPCSAAVLLAGGSGWTVRGARRLSASDRQAVLAEPAGLLAQAAAAGRALVIHRPAEAASLAGMRALRECREVVCVPLMTGGSPGGALLIGWAETPLASPTVLAELEAIGRLTSAALEGLGRLGRVEAEKLRQGEVQEESRRRLARDLHDGPTQAVASLAMRLNYIGKLVDRDPAAARLELATAEEMARRATRDIRHMLFALRPLILESQGLVPALWQLGQKVHEVQGEQVIVEAERDDAEGMSPLQQSITFYIAEEAINNAVKHAQARHIWVRLKPVSSGWRLEIEDDGVGFNVGAVDEDYAQRGSLGLVSMRERAALTGGQLRIDSQEARGTRIEVLIPRPTESAGA